jgi:hypothetical protein
MIHLKLILNEKKQVRLLISPIVSDSKKIKKLIRWALTDKINNRDMFIK